MTSTLRPPNREDARVWLSIIVPVWGRPDLLGELVASLEGQRLEMVEVIFVIDPLSPHQSEIKRVLERVDFRKEVLVGDKPYAGTQRNLGAKIALGEFVWFVDSDDLIPPGAVAIVEQITSAYSAEGYIFGALQFTDPDGELNRPSWFLNSQLFPENEPFAPSKFHDSLFQIKSPAPWNLVVRRESIENSGLEFSNSKSSNDLAFVYGLLATLDTLLVHTGEIYIYRRGAPSSVQSKISTTDLFRAFDDLERSLIRRGIFEEFQRTFFGLASRVLVRWWWKRNPVLNSLRLVLRPRIAFYLVRVLVLGMRVS